MMAAEPLPLTILTPSCGRGAFGSALRSADHTVFEDDLVAYGLGQDSARNFHNIRRGRGPIRVHVFRYRLAMMNRDGVAGNRASNAVAFAELRISWNRGAS
jgi:hypothetical protein